MADNLVDNMLNEMNANNTANVLSYQPGGMSGGGGHMGAPMGGPMGGPQYGQQYGPQYGYNPQQPMSEMRMGEVDYIPNSQQQAPTVQNNMEENMEDEDMAPTEEDAQMMMDAPDLSTYGMEEGNGGMMDKIINQSKAPLVVIVLVFLMTMPQVSGAVRNFVARFTTNPMYVNVALAIAVGVAFYMISMMIA